MQRIYVTYFIIYFEMPKMKMSLFIKKRHILKYLNEIKSEVNLLM